MKKYFSALVISFIFLFSTQGFGQSGQWVWMKGDTIFNEFGNSGGTWKVEDSSYYADALYLSTPFKDDSGRLYMFAGATWDDYFYGYDCTAGIWRYNPATN